MSNFDSILGGQMDEINLNLHRVDCFTPHPKVDFIEPKLDFDLDPDHFIKWLKAEASQDIYLDAPLGKSYAYDVSSMCEYSCLYIAMLLHEKELKGELRIISGKYGFWEHYWMQYRLEDVTYYIDLTLQQFDETAPKLAISIKEDIPSGYNRMFDIEGTSINGYLEDKEAFMFYVNPKQVK